MGASRDLRRVSPARTGERWLAQWSRVPRLQTPKPLNRWDTCGHSEARKHHRRLLSNLRYPVGAAASVAPNEVVRMFKSMLQAKLHWVRVTQSDLHYEGHAGSIRCCWMRPGFASSSISRYITSNNGERFSTYAIRAAAESGEISLNGPRCRLMRPLNPAKPTDWARSD